MAGAQVSVRVEDLISIAAIRMRFRGSAIVSNVRLKPDATYVPGTFSPIVLDAKNPGPMTGAGNNTYLVVAAGSAVLVDAGVGHPEHLAALARALADARSSLRTVVVTHGHADHASGAPAVARAHPAARFGRHVRSDDHSEQGIEWQPLQDA